MAALSEVYILNIVNRYMAIASREKLAPPNPFLQSWYPVAILLTVPVLQMILAVLFP